MRIQAAFSYFILATTRISATQAFTTQSARSLAFHRTSSSLSSSDSTKTSLAMSSSGDRYTIPDQPARFARAKAEKNDRYLNIATVYDPSFLKDKRVAVTGANRGIGLSLAKELTKQGAKLVAIVRSSSDELDALKPAEIITGIEATSDEACATISDKITGGPIDIVST